MPADITDDELRQWREEHFVCPNCGGTHFGRRTAKGDDGQVIVLDDVCCHDEHGVKCKWRGVWPPLVSAEDLKKVSAFDAMRNRIKPAE